MPIYRGFNSSLGYLGGSEGHYNQREGNDGAANQPVDLWVDDAPGYGLNGTYNAFLYTQRAVKIIQDHPEDSPLFMYHGTFSIYSFPPPLPSRTLAQEMRMRRRVTCDVWRVLIAVCGLVCCIAASSMAGGPRAQRGAAGVRGPVDRFPAQARLRGHGPLPGLGHQQYHPGTQDQGHVRQDADRLQVCTSIRAKGILLLYFRACCCLLRVASAPIMAVGRTANSAATITR